MTETMSLCNIRAIKDLVSDTVLVYRAFSSRDNYFKISAERYSDSVLIESRSVLIPFSDPLAIDDLLLTLCLSLLEPCHLNDVIHDLLDL